MRAAPVHKPRPKQHAKSGKWSSLYRTHKWKKARLSWLRRNPLCAECMKDNRVTQATVVDHITPHKGNMKLFWDRTSWQSLCIECHNKKSAKERYG